MLNQNWLNQSCTNTAASGIFQWSFWHISIIYFDRLVLSKCECATSLTVLTRK